MALRFFIFFVLVGLGPMAFAQTGSGKLSGRVVDELGNPIENANIYCDSLNRGAYTLGGGLFKMTLPAGQWTIRATHVSFSSWIGVVIIRPGETTELKITLPFREIADVVVEDSRQRETFLQAMPIKTARLNPSVNQGIERLVLSGLGVSTTSELGTGYSVRGGSFDENLVYVNDVEVYRPFLARAGQQEGLSFPNPEMVENLEFSSGGFDARFGDKLSSVLDIRYKKPQQFAGFATASLLGGSLTLEGASKNRRLTQITGVRYLTNAYVLGSLDTQGDYNPSFTDLQTYWTYKLSDELELSFLGNYSNNLYRFVPVTRQTEFGSIDQALRFTVFFDGQELTQFETFFGAGSADWRYSPTSRVKLTLSGFQTYEEESFDVLGSYRLDEVDRNLGSETFGETTGSLGNGGFLQVARNRLQALVAAANVNGYHGVGKHYVQWGVKWQLENIEDRLKEYDVVDSTGYTLPYRPGQPLEMQNVLRAENVIESSRLMAYVQDAVTLDGPNNTSWSFTGGLRAQHWTWNSETVISPRFTISHRPNWKYYRRYKGDTLRRDVVLKASVGYYFQPPFYREMRRFDGTLNSDIRAQKSIHYIVGADVNLEIWQRPFKFMTEAYYKSLSRLIPYEVDNVRLIYFGDNLAEGYATGLDMKLAGEFVPGLESWLMVSVMDTREDLLNDSFLQLVDATGERLPMGSPAALVADTLTIFPGAIPRPNDRRFFFNMFFHDEMPGIPTLRATLSFVYGTGLPYGPPTRDRYNDTARMPAYRRVDLGITKVLIDENNPGKGKILGNLKNASVGLEVFNLLGINNVISYTWIADAANNRYAIPNYLTGRRVNLRLSCAF